jgi:regulatory protein
MTESVVQCRPRPRNRLSVTLSGGRSFTIPESEAAGFEAGTLLSTDEVAKLARIDQYLRGKEKAFRLLSIRSRTRQELATALENIDLDPAVTDGIIQELHDRGFIDDLRFAREYMQAKIEFKSLGPHRLRADLIRMGVKRSYIDQVLNETFTDVMQEELARRVARKRIGSGALDVRAVKRVSDALKRKGFDFEVVNRVTFELLDEVGSDDISEDN